MIATEPLTEMSKAYIGEKAASLISGAESGLDLDSHLPPVSRSAESRTKPLVRDWKLLGKTLLDTSLLEDSHECCCPYVNAQSRKALCRREGG